MSIQAGTISTDTTNRRHLHAMESRWFALYTPYKREKTAIKALRKRGIECYVPLVERTKKYERKIKTYHVPLINNYIFVKIVCAEYVSVLETRDVVDFVRFDKEIIAVPDNEIALLQRIVGESIPIYGEETKPLIGQEVEVIHGKLTGIKGVVSEEKGKHQVVIDLDTLGWSLRLEVHPKYLRPLR